MPRALMALVAATGFLAAAAPASAQTTTIGADVNQMPTTSGTCAHSSPPDRPCLYLNKVIPNRAMTSPCDGRVVSFRLNGIPTANTYRLRVVRDNGDGTFTSTGRSGPVQVTQNGVNGPFPTSLPIKAGEYVALDFDTSTVDFGVRWVYVGPSITSHYFRPFPADGVPDAPNGTEQSYYLFNADVTCGTPGQAAANKCAKKKKKKKKPKGASAAKKKKKGCKKKGKKKGKRK